MGLGSSREQYGLQPRRRPTGPGLGSRHGKKRRRGFFRRIRQVPTTQPVIPVRHHSYHQNLYGRRPYVPQIPYYGLQQPIYPASVPYNNYIAPSYMSPRQPMMMMPPQQYQAMMPQPIPQSQPMMVPPQQVPLFQPGMMPQQVPQPRPMMMPHQVPPYMYSPYMYPPPSMGMPVSSPYVQQQPQVQPIYNNIGGSAPVSTGMTGPAAPYPSSYQRTFGKLSTDWTGGGKISPGFLGPPI
jgi:hypothetical protein